MTSNDLHANRLRALSRAYEVGRVKLAFAEAWPVVPMVALSLLTGSEVAFATGVGAVLLALVIALRARGEVYGRAVLPGLVTGAAPLILPMVTRSAGHCCVGGACMPVCLLACVVGGVLAGASLGLWAATETSRRGAFLGASAMVAGLAGSLGCVMMGSAGVLGMAVAVLATSFSTAYVRAARA